MALAVVSDASPIRALVNIDMLSLLHRLYDRIVVPPAVWSES